MKKIEKALFHGTAYSLLILALYYFFAAVTGNESTVQVNKFLLICLFGFITSTAEFIFSFRRFGNITKKFIHFAILLIAFCVIFISGGFIKNNGPATIFAVIIVFSLFYFAILLISVLLKRFLNKADKALDKAVSERNETKQSKEKQAYQPRFK